MEDTYDTSAPFNMAIATLMSLRTTLDMIRNIEGRLDFPPEERQRIKLELVKRFYVDSSPLVFDKKVLDKYESVLDLRPVQVTLIDKSTQRKRVKNIYDFDLNKKMDKCLLDIQIELQKKKYFMPPKDDMGTIGARMS